MSTAISLVIAAACAVGAFLVLVTRVFHPHHRRVAFWIWVVGWAPLAIAAVTHWQTIQVEAGAVRGVFMGYGPHLAALAALLLTAYVARVLFPTHPTIADPLEHPELAARVEDDLQHLVYLFDWLDGALAQIRESHLLERDAPAFTAEDDAALRELWARFVEASFELHVMMDRYRSFRSINPLTETELHARGFLVAYGAYVAVYRAGARMTQAVGDNETVRTILDDANAAHDIAPGSYAALQRESVHPDAIVRLNVGRAYLKVMEPSVEDEAAFPRVKAYLYDVEHVVESSPETFLDNPIDYLERVAFDAWFPVQKTVALGIGAVHVSSHEYAITEARAREAAAQLEPGDVLLQRREWHLTNLGIPGYWTHAALYIGTLDELDRYFEGLDELDDRAARDDLADVWPDAATRLAEPDEGGHPRVVLEAIGEGVVLRSLEKSGSCDALAALRPNVSRAARLRAVVDALEHLGKPYDYDFDFRTDSGLVCSEVIYRAYRAVDGVDFETSTVNGRPLVSPNDIAQKVDAEYDDEGARQLELALFLDRDADGSATERGVEEFRESHLRPKWHILIVE